MFIMPLWLIYSILTGLASNTHNFMNRYLLRNNGDSSALAWYFETVRLIVFSIFAIFDWSLVITPYSIFIFFLFGITEFFAIYYYMKMHAYSHLSVSTILSRTRVIWIPVLAFFIVGESLSIPAYIGILIVFLGVSITVAPTKIFVDKGALYANLFAFFVALNIVIMKLALPYGSNSVLYIIMSIPSVILFPIFMKNSKTRIRQIIFGDAWVKLLAIAFNILGLFLFAFALRVGDASKINAVYQGMLIFSVIAGIIFLKERENIMRKLIGAVITVVGVVLLSFS